MMSQKSPVEREKHRLRSILAQNILRARLTLGLSQEALAHRAGLHRTYVGSVERRERNISVDNIQKIAAALGVNADELLREDDASPRQLDGLGRPDTPPAFTNME